MEGGGVLSPGPSALWVSPCNLPIVEFYLIRAVCPKYLYPSSSEQLVVPSSGGSPGARGTFKVSFMVTTC